MEMAAGLLWFCVLLSLLDNFLVLSMATEAMELESPSFSLQLTASLGPEEEIIDVDRFLEGSNLDDIQSFMQEVEKEEWFKEDFRDTTKEVVGNEVEKEVENENFLPLDQQIMHDVYHGGKDASSKVTNWARKKFDAWRVFRKIDTSVAIEDLPLSELNEMLVMFIIQVKKNNGKLFPASSLNNLFKAIGRIVRKKQDMIIEETGIDKPRFNILHHPIFGRACKAFFGATERSRRTGVGAKKKKTAEISFKLEELLADCDHQITHNTGCQKRLCYYMVTRFGIRGQQELWGVLDCDISLRSDDHGESVMYRERVSKNWHSSVTRFDDSHFRPPIWSYEPDFVLTYKQYVRHLPEKENETPRHFVLQTIHNPRYNAWYQKVPTGVNKIRASLNIMGSLLSDVEISNKSGRVTLLSRLSMAGVPPEVGMQITGHRNIESYKKYDRTKDIQVDAAMSILASPYNDDGSLKVFSDVLQQEKNRKCMISGGTSSTLTNLECDIPVVPLVDSGSAAVDKDVLIDSVGNSAGNSTKGALILVVPCGSGTTIAVGSSLHSDSAAVGKEVITNTCGSIVNCGSAVVAKEDSDSTAMVNLRQLEIDNDIWEKCLQTCPQLEGGSLISNCSMTNSGGQSFMAATNRNCMFLSITVANASDAAPLVESLFAKLSSDKSDFRTSGT